MVGGWVRGHLDARIAVAQNNEIFKQRTG